MYHSRRRRQQLLSSRRRRRRAAEALALAQAQARLSAQTQAQNLAPAESQTSAIVPSDIVGPTREESRKLYIELCSVRLTEISRAARMAFAQKTSPLTAVQNEIFTALRRSEFALYGDMTAGRRLCLADRFARQYDQILASAQIVSATVSQNSLILRTEMLTALHPQTGRKHMIGRFAIVIDLLAGRHPVRWFNLTQRINCGCPGMNAPNVYADGTPTLSEASEGMLEMIAVLDIAVVAALALQFVENTGDDLAASRLSQWPLFEETAITTTQIDEY